MSSSEVYPSDHIVHDSSSKPHTKHVSHAESDHGVSHGIGHGHEGSGAKEKALVGLGVAGVVAAGMVYSLYKVASTVGDLLTDEGKGGHGHGGHGHDLIDFGELFSSFIPDSGGGGGGGGKSHDGGHH